MSLSSGFFNSNNGDRKYSTEQFSKIFNGIINDGVFMSIGDGLIPKANGTNTIYISSGRAWFDGTWTENDAVYPIVVPTSDFLRPRIDALVLEVNKSDAVRANSFKFIQGLANTNPSKPSITSTDDVFYHVLCYVTRRANDENVSNADLEIIVGTEECPFVTGILETLDISNLLGKWQDELDQFVDSETADISAWFDAKKQEFEDYIAESEAAQSSWTEAQQADFLAWYNSVKDQLSQDAAGNLQNQQDVEIIKRAMLIGFEDGRKEFSDDGTTITSTASDGRKVVKTFSNSFSTVTTVYMSAQGAKKAESVKEFDPSGSFIETSFTLY